MSKPLQIALVAEGVTDYVVLKAAIEAMLGGAPFDMKLFQPEGSVAFTGGGNAGQFGGGWKGVYRWCLQAAARSGGALRDDPLFIRYDLLVVHLDADVAENPTSDKGDPIPELVGILPCLKKCPPPAATTDQLRQILLSWGGENEVPPRTIFCTPSKSTEAWVVAACFPADPVVIKSGWECHPKPERRLAQQASHTRFKKSRAHYEQRSETLKAQWPKLVERMTEAARFEQDFLAAVQSLPPA